MITNICGIFIKTTYFIFLAVSEKDFFQNILMVQMQFSGNCLFTKKEIVAVLLGHVVK